MANVPPRQQREEYSDWLADIPRKVLAPMSHCIEILKRVHRESEQSWLRSRYFLGAKLKEYADALDASQHVALIYNADLAEILSDRLDMAPRMLRDCLAFAREFSLAEVDVLVARGVMWSHVVYLLGVGDHKRRWEYVRRIHEDGLTTNEIYEELVGKFRKRCSGSSRQAALSAPRKVTKATLKKATQKVTKFVGNLDAFLGEQSEFARYLSDEFHSIDDRDHADQLRTACALLTKRLQQVLSAMDRTQSHPERRLDNGNEADLSRLPDATPSLDSVPKPLRKRRPPPKHGNAASPAG